MSLPEPTPLITMQPPPTAPNEEHHPPHEHWRNDSELPPAKRDVAGGHREAYWAVALLPVPRRERAHHPVAGHAGQDRRRHGDAAGAVLRRYFRRKWRHEVLAPVERRRDPLPLADPALRLESE